MRQFIMAELTAEKVIRRVRRRLGLSQEGLSRLLNATKGAVQHWERGRNNPDLGRLLALRQLCPPSAERKELDSLIRQVRAEFAPVIVGNGKVTLASATAQRRGRRASPASVAELASLRRENERLARQMNKLQELLDRRNEQLSVLEDLASELRKDVSRSRTK
jgi:transcriptional regulator with XRE-family HTH domain